jgi:small subunit ribosomal protein S2e
MILVQQKGLEAKWIPVTKLGCLVKDTKIKSLEETYLFFFSFKNLRLWSFSWEHSSKVRF